MPIRHAKRVLLERDLSRPWAVRSVPFISFETWLPHSLSDHAIALVRSFQDAPDKDCFPSLTTETGCRDLLHDLVGLPEFCPEATWLARDGKSPIGTIQAIINHSTGHGEIQNLGVIPSHRGQGIAHRLLSLSLGELRLKNCRLVRLEVTANNDSAVMLYRNFGFEPYKTFYTPIRSALTETGSGI